MPWRALVPRLPGGPATDLPVCPVSDHADHHVVKDGHCGKPPRQRFRCVGPDGFHRFVPQLPRRIAHDEVRDTCDSRVPGHRGSGHGAQVRVPGAGGRCCARGGGCRGVLPAGCPAGGTRLAFHVLGAYGYLAAGHGPPRVRALAAYHHATATEWEDFPRRLDTTVPPRMVITDDAVEIADAVRHVWPAQGSGTSGPPRVREPRRHSCSAASTTCTRTPARSSRPTRSRTGARCA